MSSSPATEPRAGKPARGGSSQPAQSRSTAAAPEGIARRDWFLLPLIAVLTASGLLVALKATADRMYTDSQSSTLSCLILNDPTTGVRAIPNSVCHQKALETESAEYRFNSCGHRAGMECGPKPDGAYRIVLVGSSYNYGMWVSREQSFAALLPEKISLLTGRPVQLYNESMQWGFPPSTVLRFHKVFDAKPDMILWVLTPYDISKAFELMPFVPPAPVANQKPVSALSRVKLAFAENSLPKAVSLIWDRAVTAPWAAELEAIRWKPSGILLEHLLYASNSLYLKSSLTQPDTDIGYLHSAQSSLWHKNLVQFDKQAANVEGQARAAGIPFVAVLVPERAQAAMISNGEWPAGYDPFKIDDQLRTIITSHGGTYFDVLHDFRNIPGSERLFFPVDGHPDAKGHALLADLLAKQITSGPVDALRANPDRASTQPSVPEHR